MVSPASQEARAREHDQRWRELVEALLAGVLVLVGLGLGATVFTPPPPAPEAAPVVEVALEELRQLPWGVWIDSVLPGDGRGRWRVENVPGQWIILEASSNVFSTTLQLRLSTGDEMVGVADTETGDSRLQTMLSGDGVVEVTAAFGQSGDGGQPYRVRVRRIVASELDWNVWVAAELGGEEERHGMWRVEGRSEQVIVVEAKSGVVDTVLRLLASTGEEIASNDDISVGLRDSRLQAILTENGQHFVEVTAFLGGDRQQEGSYDVRAREIAPRELEWNRVVSAELGDGDAGHGVWRIEGRAGQMIAVEVHSDVFYTNLRLLSASGAEIAQNNGGNGEGDSARVQTILPDDGVYWVEVAALEEVREGAYTVEARGR